MFYDSPNLNPLRQLNAFNRILIDIAVAGGSSPMYFLTLPLSPKDKETKPTIKVLQLSQDLETNLCIKIFPYKNRKPVSGHLIKQTKQICLLDKASAAFEEKNCSLVL